LNLLLVLFSLGFLTPTPVFAEEIKIPQTVYSTSTAEFIVRSYAVKYGVSGDEMWDTTKCENPTLNPKQQSNYYRNGEREDSWGNSQINLYWHPDITKEQAQDPFFAAEFMAKEFSEGNQRKWTCWRNLFGKKSG
jgi:hypothetical protein